MRLSPMHRARWPLWLAGTLAVVACGAMWWQPWVDDAVAPVPALPVSSPAVAPPIEVATPAPALKLVGTVTAGAGSFATVIHATDSQLLQLRVGDRVDGLAVTAIEPGRIVLAGAGQPIAIEADEPVAVPATPAPVSRPAASQAAPPAWPEGEAPWDLVPPFQH